MLPVAGQRRPVLAAKRLTLGKESTQVGLIGNILGREEANGPFLQIFQKIRIVRTFRIFRNIHHRETFFLLGSTHKLVINIVSAHTILRLTNGDDVDTLARPQMDSPVVLRYSCNNVITRQCPVLPNAAILNPDVLVLLSKSIVGDGILGKYAGMRLAVVVHDVTLVVDDVLNSNRRRNHLTRGTEMVELTTL